MANKKSKLLLGLIAVFIMSLVFALTPLLMANAETDDEATFVVKVNDTEYSSLEDASNNLVDGCTVTLGEDFSGKKFTLPENLGNDFTVTLDLNGHSIVGNDASSYPYSPIVVRSGNLTIIDKTASEGSAGDSVISGTTTNGAVYVTGGNVTIEAGNYISYSKSGQTVRTTTDAAGSTVTINGGTYTSVGYGMQIENGTLIINGGVIKSSATKIGEQDYEASVKGAVAVKATGDYSPVLTINGGYFTSKYNDSGMIVYVVDNTSEGGTAYDYATNVNIKGGYFDTNNYTVSRYVPDGYEVYENTDESTKSSYPYCVAKVEATAGSIGYGYATIDADGNVSATLVSTYTDVSGAVYRANKLVSGDLYGYVHLSTSEEALTSSINISSDYKIILDLAGVNINVSAGVAIQVSAGAELILIDSVGTSTVTSGVKLSGTIRNAGGTLKIYGGTYENTDTLDKNSAIIFSVAVSGDETTDSATTLIYGGTFNGNTSESSNGSVLYLNPGTTATIYGGNFNTSAICYCSSDSNTLTVYGGYYTTAPTTYLADGCEVLTAVSEEATYICCVVSQSQIIGGVSYDLASGKIVLNITVNAVNDVVTSSENISVQVGEQEAGKNAEITYAESVYTIAQKVDATQLVDTISVVVTPVGYTSYTYTTSVKEYLNGIYDSSSEKEQAVITALLDYASAVQQLNDSTLSGNALASGGKYSDLSDIDADYIKNAGYTKKTSQDSSWGEDNATLSSMSLNADYDFNLTLIYTASVEAYTVTVTVNGTEYENVTVSGNKVIIKGLSAEQLTQALSVKLSTADSAASYTTNTYGLYWARLILNSSASSDAQKLVAKTLYVYATAVVSLNSAS